MVMSVNSIEKDQLDLLIARYDAGESKYEIKIDSGIDLTDVLTSMGKKRTSKEAHRLPRYQSRLKASVRTKFGVDNVSQCPQIKKKKKETCSNRYGVIHNFLIPEIVEKRHEALTNYFADKEKMMNSWKKCIQTINEKYGENIQNPAQLSFSKEKISKAHLELNAHKTIEQKHEMTSAGRKIWHETFLNLTDQERETLWKSRLTEGFISSLEKRICEILDTMQIKYSTQIFIEKINYDIVINDIIFLEVQGDYWHANPLMYETNDRMIGGKLAKEIWKKDERKKQNILKRKKYFYEIWESDMSKMTNEDLKIWLTLVINEVIELENSKKKESDAR